MNPSKDKGKKKYRKCEYDYDNYCDKYGCGDEKFPDMPPCIGYEYCKDYVPE